MLRKLKPTTSNPRSSTTRPISIKPTTSTTTSTNTHPYTISQRFAGKRVQSKNKTPSKKVIEAKKTSRDIKQLIKGAVAGGGNTTSSTSSSHNTKSASQFLTKTPVISKKNLHPTLPQDLVSKVPSTNTSLSSQITNPTAQHVQINPTATTKALQDPILINQGQGLVLNNGEKPYFRYGLCRTIKLPPNPAEIQQSITKRQQQVQEAKGFNNPKDRIRDHCMRRLQIGTQIFLSRLDSATNSLPTVLTLLHPFEYELATITLAQHAHDNPIPFDILKALPTDDTNVLLQYVLLQEQRIDSTYNEHVDQHRLEQIRNKLFQLQQTSPHTINPASPDFNLNYVNFTGEENYTPIDGFTNLRVQGTVYYSTILYNVNKCRELVIHHYYKFKKMLNAAQIPQDMHQVSKQEIAEMTKLLQSPLFTTTMSLFRSMSLLLKNQHWIDPNIPTLLCVGAPNVGKSSIVRALSTSKTLVHAYRFTTRKLTMGHIDVNNFTCQVTDSPGLLPRPDELRNAMEALTIAAIKHLPLCSIAFVLDPTVQGGVSVQHQLLLRHELRWRFGHIIGNNNWIDVITKGDVWNHKYGIKKNTLPLTDMQLYTYDDVSMQLAQVEDEVVVADDDNDQVAPVEPVVAAPKKRGRPRKNPLPADTSTTQVNNTTVGDVQNSNNKAPVKEKGITPHWTLPNALDELKHILPPAHPSDALLPPSYTISTIHLRDVHNEEHNMDLKKRFLKNKKAKQKEKAEQERQRQIDEAESHRVGGALYTPQLYSIGDDVNDGDVNRLEDRFDSLSFEEYEKWWDSLPPSQQKIYTQAINDTDNVNNGVIKMLGRMVKVVEQKQHDHQLNVINEQEENEYLEEHARLRGGMTPRMKTDEW